MRSRLVPLLLSTIALVALLIRAAPAAGQATPVAVACPEIGPASPAAESAVSYPLTVTDDVGREVTIAQVPRRIVSIAPSNTEILFALGLGDRVVGVDDMTDYPPEATAKPRVGSYVEPNLEQLVAAEPDLVLAAGIHAGTVLSELESFGLPTVVVEPENLEEVFAGIGLVGRIAGEPARAERLVCELAARVEAVEAAVAGGPRPRVFFELSPDLYTAGPDSFIDDLIERAGGENVAAGAAEMWPQLSAEAVVAADPEVVLLADHVAGITPEQVAARPGWQNVAAVAQGRVSPIDPDLVARPGPRVVDGLEAIARALHPDRFPEPGS